MSSLWSQVTSFILSTPVFPYIWLPHCIIMCLALRATLGMKSQALRFARLHPLSCYILAIIYTFSGAFVGLLLRNQSVLTILSWSNNFYSFTVIWYLMFFGPKDFLYRIMNHFPLAPFLVVAQDWLRIGVVRNGVKAMLEEQPQLFLYPVVFASVTANGFMFVKYIEKLLLNGFGHALVIEHHASKTMVFAAILLTAQAHNLIPNIDSEDLFCLLVLGAVFLRLLTTFVLRDWDPYISLESQVCSLLYGSPDFLPEEAEPEKIQTKKDKIQAKKDK